MPIDNDVENILKEENAQSIAVRSLIEIKPRDEKNIDSDVELKTDLTENAVVNHTAISLLNHVLSSNNDDFKKRPIIGDLIHIKERKLISKDRKSRGEIVELAKSPETPILSGDSGMNNLKKFFVGKQGIR